MTVESNLTDAQKRQHDKLWIRACGMMRHDVVLDNISFKKPGFFARRRLRKAIGFFQQVLALNPDNSGAMFLIGKAFFSLGEPEESLKWLAQAHERKPEDPLVSMELGTMAGRLGRHDEAVRVMKAAIERNPEFARLHFNLGLEHLFIGDAASARAFFARAVELEPERVMNKALVALAADVESGKRPCPKNEVDIAKAFS